jgi:REP element-mobilizing transposase RayT
MNDKNERYLFPVRKNLRLQDFDYSSQNAYFITICTQNKGCLFGEVEHDKMRLNQYGIIAEDCWKDLGNHYPGISNDIFMVMPNHVHGTIIVSCENGREGSKPSPTKPTHLSEIVRALKRIRLKELTHSDKHQAFRCGSAVITNMLFGTKMIIVKLVSTF